MGTVKNVTPAIVRRELSIQELNKQAGYVAYSIDWRPFKEKVEELIEMGAPITFKDFQIWIEGKLTGTYKDDIGEHLQYELLVNEKDKTINHG